MQVNGEAVAPNARHAVISAAEPLLGTLVAQALVDRGVHSTLVSDLESVDLSGSIAVAIPPASAGEFHAENWTSKLQKIPVNVPLVVIGRTTLPIRPLLETRSNASGVALLDSTSLDDVDSLHSVIGLVGDGLRIVDPGFEEALGANSTTLSIAERSVLELMVHGYSNKAIADELFLSVRTVETHIRNIFTRMGIERDDAIHRRVLLTRLVLDGSSSPRRLIA